ncbi:MAG TPA: hypothetical protein VGT41_04500 [Candidatus Babeliales bacterium]|nr:hypothetical protein [Candidatus Babeliales bacterium]
MIQKRSIPLITLFIFSTLSIIVTTAEHPMPAIIFAPGALIAYMIFYLHWLVTTKNELNCRGASIPTAWFIIIPFLNIYFFYKYSQAFSRYILNGKASTTLGCFLLIFFMQPIAIIILQMQLNKLARSEPTSID